MQKTASRILLFILFLTFSILFVNKVQANDSEIVSLISIRKVEKNKLVEIDSVEIQINNRKGDEASEVVIGYSKNQKLTIESAWIEDMQGNVVRKLKNNEITTRNYIPNFSLYQDFFIKEFQLRHNVYPYKIFYSYKCTSSDFFYIDDWKPYVRIGQSVRTAKLIVETPSDYEIKYKYEHIDEPLIVKNNKTTTYQWETSYEKQNHEPYAPYSALETPKVMIEPFYFKYGLKGSWESWESFGSWVNQLNVNAQKLPLSEQQTIDRLLSGITDNKEKIKILYSYLQKNTRYINVSINIGGLKTYPAEYVATNKYGDCKALSNYMISMLKYIGIPAYYTLVKSGDEIKEIDYSFPAQVFDHVIVTVPLKNDTLFLECTNKNIPCGYLGTFTQGRKAFVIDEKSYFIQTPFLDNEDVKCTSNIEVHFKDKKSHIKWNMIQRGDSYEKYSYISNNLNESNQKHYLQDLFAGSYNLAKFSINNTQTDLPEIDLSVDLEMNSLIQTYGNRTLVNPISHILPDFAPSDKRTQTLQINYPIYYSDTITYNLQNNKEIKPVLNKNSHVESKYGTYHYDYTVSENQLIVTKEVLIYRGKYEIEDYASFYEFYSGLKANEQQTIHLEYYE